MAKIAAYKLQEQGLDTVDANVHLGYDPDERDYGVGAQILRALGVTKMRLITNNPVKRVGLEAYGLEIVENVPMEITPNEYNLPAHQTRAYAPRVAPEKIISHAASIVLARLLVRPVREFARWVRDFSKFAYRFNCLDASFLSTYVRFFAKPPRNLMIRPPMLSISRLKWTSGSTKFYLNTLPYVRSSTVQCRSHRAPGHNRRIFLLSDEECLSVDDVGARHYRAYRHGSRHATADGLQHRLEQSRLLGTFVG